MIVMSVVTALVLLALATQAGVLAVQRAFPPQGRMIEVDGAVLHLVDLGPHDSGLPVVMLHGASSNLEVMRLAVGERLANRHRVILIPESGHPDPESGAPDLASGPPDPQGASSRP